jgi:hypothetical protein
MTLEEVKTKIHEYYLESEREGLGNNNMRTKGEYPNAILLTKDQYKSLLKEVFKLQEEIDDKILEEVKIMSIEGLRVIFTEHVEEPKILRLKEQQ